MFITPTVRSAALVFLLLQSLWVSTSVAADATTALTQEEKQFANWLRSHVDAHPAVLAARAQIDAARSRVAAADKALFNPELELDLEKTDIDTQTLGFSQEIDWGDQRGARTRIAELQQQIAWLDYVETRHDVAAELLSALAQWLGASSVYQLAEQRLELMRRFAELAALRHKAGDLSQVDLDLATLALSEARFQSAIAYSDKVSSKQKLVTLTGDDSEQWPALLDRLPVLKLQDEDLQAILEKLPAMRRVKAQVLAAQAEVAMRRSEASANPTIAIRGGKDGDESLIGLNLSIPLQVRNNFQAEIEAANAEYIAAQSDANNRLRQLRSRLRSALSSYQASLSAWQAWLHSGDRSLKQQITLLQRLWKAGELSTTDYLVQLKQALDTRASAYEQRSVMWQNWAEWLAASGQIQEWLLDADSTRETSESSADSAAFGGEKE